MAVDQAGDHVDEADDLLGARVARRGLGAKDERARRDLVGRVRIDAVVQHEDVQRVEQLALILVQALHLHVEHRIRIDLHALLARQPVGKACLVLALDAGELLAESGVVAQRQDVLDLLDVVTPAVADALIQQRGQARIGQHQPAARRDAVGDGRELLGHDGIVVLERLLLEDLAVQLGHAVDAVAVGDAQIGHVHLVVGQDGHAADALPLAGEALEQAGAQAAVEFLQDGVDAGQQLAHHVLRPALERLGHDGVVGIGDGASRQILGLLPGQPLLVHEDAHELGDHQAGVRVVDVERHALGQLGQVLAIGALVVLDRILQRGGGEEVVLLEAQHLALVVLVLGVEHLGDDLGQFALLGCARKVAPAEGGQVDALGRAGAPQAQAVDDVGIIADDGDVIRHGDDGLVVLEGYAQAAIHPLLLQGAAEVDLDGVLQRGDLPGVAVFEPAVGQLDLLAVDDALAEQAVLIADGAAHGGQVQRGERIHEAGGQAAQAAVAQRGLGLLAQHVLHLDAQVVKRGLIVGGGAQVEHVVVQPAAGQKLDGQVVQALGLLLAALFLLKAPLLHDLVAHGGGDGLVDLLAGGFLQRAAVVALQFAQD